MTQTLIITVETDGADIDTEAMASAISNLEYDGYTVKGSAVLAPNQINYIQRALERDERERGNTDVAGWVGYLAQLIEEANK